MARRMMTRAQQRAMWAKRDKRAWRWGTVDPRPQLNFLEHKIQILKEKMKTVPQGERGGIKKKILAKEAEWRRWIKYSERKDRARRAKKIRGPYDPVWSGDKRGENI